MPYPTLQLTERDRALLGGESGPGTALAMGLLATLAEAQGAEKFIDISGAHIDGCLFHGQAGIDFVRALRDGDAAVKVPTTLNVSSLDLIHPELYRGPDSDRLAARMLMDLHVDLGCSPTWTCAPYQLPGRPSLGDQVAWGESNAIVFANSVLGARTNRYGDFADLACAVTGRAPASGLHLDEGRVARLIIELDVPDSVFGYDAFYPVFGLWLGATTGTNVPAIVGLPASTSEDDLKAIGAAGASSGSLAMFHAVGRTPEADTIGDCLDGPVPTIRVGLEELAEVRHRLGMPQGTPAAVSVGTPHMSADELTVLAGLASGRTTRIPFYVSTGRDVLASMSPTVVASLQDFGATVVLDTCTYITPIIGAVDGPIMTNSGKWAYYAPGNLGVDVVFAGLEECVESAISGRFTLSSSPFS